MVVLVGKKMLITHLSQHQFWEQNLNLVFKNKTKSDRIIESTRSWEQFPIIKGDKAKFRLWLPKSLKYINRSLKVTNSGRHHVD
jgi:hypothetical protein